MPLQKSNKKALRAIQSLPLKYPNDFQNSVFWKDKNKVVQKIPLTLFLSLHYFWKYKNKEILIEVIFKTRSRYHTL